MVDIWMNILKDINGGYMDELRDINGGYIDKLNGINGGYIDKYIEGYQLWLYG